MPRKQFTPIEAWATRSKMRAFGFLFGLAVLISTSLLGGAILLASVARYGVLPLAAASTP